MDLLTLTNAVNFAGTAMGVWLGVFVLTRSPERAIARVTALLMWACAGFFLSNLMYLNALPEGRNNLWLIFFRSSTLFVPALWLHLTAELAILDKAVIFPFRRTIIASAHLLAFALFALDTWAGPALLLPERPNVERVLSGSRVPTALFAVYVLFILLCALQSARNLIEARKLATGTHLARANEWAIRGTGLAAIGGLWLTGAILLGLATPSLPGDLLFGAGVALTGYAAAYITALLDGRSIARDFPYALLGIGIVCVLYMAAAFVSQVVYGAPFVSFVFLLLLAVATHSLLDGGRAMLDLVFFPPAARALRANLRHLAHEAGDVRDLRPGLRALFVALCQSLGVTHGALLLCKDERYTVESGYRLTVPTEPIPPAAFQAVELTALSGPTPLGPMAWLAPLQLMDRQEGAVLLGAKTTGANYSEDDEDLILETLDRMENLLAQIRLSEERARSLTTRLAEYHEAERAVAATTARASDAEAPLAVGGVREKEFIAEVEDALRHASDIPYLGEHHLSRLHVVARRLAPGAATNLDRGRALRQLLLDALNKLRPADVEPKVPTNDWYAYLIMRDAYAVGVPNKEIMARLYLSEGTFNRTRRRAVRAVARVIAELDAAPA